MAGPGVPSVRITNVLVQPAQQVHGEPDLNLDIVVTTPGGPVNIAPGMSHVFPLADVTSMAAGTVNSGGTARVPVDIG